MTRCKGCGAKTRWVTMEGEGLMLVNSPPEKRVVLTERGGVETGRVVSLWVPHWATCPQADAFRDGGS